MPIGAPPRPFEVYTTREVEVDYKLQDLYQHINAMKDSAPDQSGLGYNTDLPFGANIMQEQLSKYFKIP